MRFPRQAKIFCGPLDPAPVAGMLMLVVLFVLLFSLVYTPGVRLEINPALADPEGVILITRTNTAVFQGAVYKAGDLGRLRGAMENAAAQVTISVQREPGGPVELEQQVKELINIQLPKSDNWTSTDNPKTIVAVNLRGQFFYESKMVDEGELRTNLTAWQQAASRESTNLTMVLLADKGVKNEMLMRLRLLARDAGIREVLLAMNPGVFSTQPAPARK